jgi:hypothetical protein
MGCGVGCCLRLERPSPAEPVWVTCKVSTSANSLVALTMRLFGSTPMSPVSLIRRRRAASQSAIKDSLRGVGGRGRNVVVAFRSVALRSVRQRTPGRTPAVQTGTGAPVAPQGAGSGTSPGDVAGRIWRGLGCRETPRRTRDGYPLPFVAVVADLTVMVRSPTRSSLDACFLELSL